MGGGDGGISGDLGGRNESSREMAGGVGKGGLIGMAIWLTCENQALLSRDHGRIVFLERGIGFWRRLLWSRTFWDWWPA